MPVRHETAAGEKTAERVDHGEWRFRLIGAHQPCLAKSRLRGWNGDEHAEGRLREKRSQ
jgi:hypothetical protein